MNNRQQCGCACQTSFPVCRAKKRLPFSLSFLFFCDDKLPQSDSAGDSLPVSLYTSSSLCLSLSLPPSLPISPAPSFPPSPLFRNELLFLLRIAFTCARLSPFMSVFFSATAPCDASRANTEGWQLLVWGAGHRWYLVLPCLSPPLPFLPPSSAAAFYSDEPL